MNLANILDLLSLLQEEILGQLAAKKSAKAAVKTKKAENTDYTGSAEESEKGKAAERDENAETKGDRDGEPIVKGNADEQRAAKRVRKQKRIDLKKKIRDLFSDGVGVGSEQAARIVSQASAKFTLEQLSAAANALHSSYDGLFSEAEFMAKAEEVQIASRNGERPKKPTSKQLNKEKRSAWNAKKKDLTNLLVSALDIQHAEAVELITHASAKFTARQMSEAAHALHESNGGKFTEEKFMAKAAEYQKAQDLADHKVTKAARKAATKAAKRERNARTDTTKAFPGINTDEKVKVVSESASKHETGPQQYQQAGDDVLGNGPPPSKGFSTEFWMDLAGSREAAAVNAAA